MTFPSKLIQVHMPPLTATEVIGSSAKNLTATGTTRTDSYQLKDSINSFSTVASGTGARLPACENNCMCVVNNYGASTLTVYPFETSGVTIDGATSFQVAANKTAIFFGVQTNWITVYDTSSGGGGGAAWGSITGTLSDQTDLQTALDAKLDASSVSAFGLTLIDDADATEARGTLGLGTAATSNTGDFATAAQGALADSALQSDDIGVTVQAYDAQLSDIAGLTPTDNGVIIGNGTNFVLESGATLRTSLGLAIGTDVQAYDAQLDDVAGLTPTDNGVIIGNGTNFVVESGSTLRTSLGLAIGTDVQAYDADTTKNDVANVFTQPNEFVKTFTDWTAETYNATQTLDALVPAGTTTLTGNMTLNAVSNSTTGEMQVIVRAFTQDATGGRTLAYNTSVFSASSASFPQPTSTASRVSLFQFTKMPDGKWAVQSLNDVRST